MKLTALKSTLQTIKPRLQSQITATQRVRGRAAVTAIVRVKLRDNYTCANCGHVTRALEVDHIIPLWQGGADTDSNKQCLCIECHKTKTAHEAAARLAASGQ